MASEYSVVIVHYGDPALTAECLRSVAGADLAPRECIVVWNGPSAVAEFAAARAGWGCRGAACPLRVLDPSKNVGYAGGANLGIHAALESGASAVLLANNDCTLEAAAPRTLLEVFATDPRVGVAGPRILDAEKDTIWHDGGAIAWPEGRPVSLRAQLRSEQQAPATPFDVDFVCGCAPLIRGAAFREVGGFDERYFFSYEDADFSLRLRAAGWRALHVPSARTRHHVSASSGERSPVSRYYRLRNRLLFARDHTPDPQATHRACSRLRRGAILRALRWLVAGRRAEARATFAALRDFRAGRFGQGEV